jgi:hypothetical protein
MSTDLIRYDLLAQEALRGVVRRVLSDVAKKGLPGEHHFFISFDTRAGGVRMSPRLREQHPEEMTVVLQHQFWDLVVSEQAFEVGLSFKGIPERLLVPFEAIKGFYDPSVKFGLKFELAPDAMQAPGADAAQASPGGQKPAKPRRTSRSDAKPAEPPAAAPSNAEPGKDAAKADRADDKSDATKDGAQVVQLDRFRKK